MGPPKTASRGRQTERVHSFSAVVPQKRLAMRTRHSEWLKGAPAPAQGPAAAHEQPPSRMPGTVSGKRPTEASLQRAREYKDWLIALPVPDEVE